MVEVEFKDFKVGDFFDSHLSTRGNKGIKKEGEYRVISGVTENNGINGYTDDIYEKEVVYENILTISNRGAKSGKVFYHPYKFVLSNNVIALVPKITMTKGVKLYVSALMSKLPYSSYSSYPTKSGVLNDILTLPIKGDGTPDFQYMENYIKEIEQKYISNLKQKLETDKTNLLKVIGKKEEDLEKVIDEGFTEGTDYGEFKVGDLFDGYIGKFVGPDYRRKDIEGDYKIPLVTSQTTNKGIQAYVKEGEYRQFCRCLSIAKDGNGGTTFYHEYPFTVGNVAMAIFAKDKYKDSINSKNVYMYLGTTVEKLAKSFGSYSKKVGWNLFGMSIKLPVTSEGEPDFEYMERYISYIELAHTHNHIETERKRIELIEELVEGSLQVK